MNTNDTLITIKDAASLLNVSISTITRMVYSKTLKSIKIRKQIRIYKSSLDEYVKNSVI